MMALQKFQKLMTLWDYSLGKGTNVILMRHAPATADGGALSQAGKRIATEYQRNILHRVAFGDRKIKLFCADKVATRDTLKILFPFSNPSDYRQPENLNNDASDSFRKLASDCHRHLGRFCGYGVNHTYYLHYRTIFQAERLAKGIVEMAPMCRENIINIYCGQSPAIEIGLENVLGISMPQALGGLLSPLDSIHLKIIPDALVSSRLKIVPGGERSFIARINPIVGYIDNESEAFFE